MRVYNSGVHISLLSISHSIGSETIYQKRESQYHSKEINKWFQHKTKIQLKKEKKNNFLSQS